MLPVPFGPIEDGMPVSCVAVTTMYVPFRHIQLFDLEQFFVVPRGGHLAEFDDVPGV